MRLRTAVPLLLAFALTTVASAARAQAGPDSATADTLHTHLLKLRDGSTLVGRVLAETPDSIRFESNGTVFTVPRTRVEELRAITPREVKNGEYWFPDPNETRLFFAPTARTLKKGEGYFSDSYLLFLNFVGGVTSNVTMGGGFSIIPSTNPQNNVVYLTPKVGLLERPNFALAAGALIGFAGFEDLEARDRSFGIAYGVASAGPPDHHLDLGLGWGYTGGKISGDPAVMLGGATRISRRTALVTENYIVPSVSKDALVSYGVRFFGEKLSVDLAFFNVTGGDFLFPGIPYIAFAVKF